MSMYYLINLVHTCLDGGFIAMILEGCFNGVLYSDDVWMFLSVTEFGEIKQKRSKECN